MTKPDPKSGSDSATSGAFGKGVFRSTVTTVQPQDGYPCDGQRVDRVQDPEAVTEIILANSTVDWGAGIGFIRWATLCSHDYRDGIAPHTDW
ncbi:hypothetical protein ABT009_41565 [Streptomyces sp. NPDC002896]|uniref:hypothetical protein n=1 Tax=Streptomyces sp. NPDC002896 TaxID=3154438 RepID=UPI00331DF7BF